MRKLIFPLCLFLVVYLSKCARSSDTQVALDNTSVTIVIPKGVTVEKRDVSVFHTYAFKYAGKMILGGYVGMAPGFPSKYAGGATIQKCRINGLSGRLIRWSDKQDRNNSEYLFAIPYGNSIGYLHLASIGQDAINLKKAEDIVSTTKASAPYYDSRSSGLRFLGRIRRSILACTGRLLKTKKQYSDAREELDEEVQVSLDAYGLYPPLK